MKRKCPMCAEEIQAKAKLCKHCRSPVKPLKPYSKLGCLGTVVLLLLGVYLIASNVDDPSEALPSRGAPGSPPAAPQ